MATIIKKKSAVQLTAPAAPVSELGLTVLQIEKKKMATKKPAKALQKPAETLQAPEPAQPPSPSAKTFPVAFVAPQTLFPYYRNNKAHNRRQITLLARVLRTHGFDQPIVVDKDNIIIKGHGRWMAALEAKLPMVPVVVRADLQEWEVQAARIADNQSFSLSAIDTAKAREEVNEFVKEGGVGAEFYFDFLRPPSKSSDPAAATTGGVGEASPQVDGLLQTCPKCVHVFMEV